MAGAGVAGVAIGMLGSAIGKERWRRSYLY
jgi:hypothetical protein